MIMEKIKKSAAGLLAAAIVLTTCAAGLYADSVYKEESGSDIISAESEELEEDGGESDDTVSQEPVETETASGGETEEVTEEAPDSPSESEPPVPEETPAATTAPIGGFVVPTEPPLTAPPIIIILVEPSYNPPDTTSKAGEPVSPDPLSFETTEPIPAQASEYREPTVNKHTVIVGDVPPIEIEMNENDLLNAVVDPFEKNSIPNGSEFDVILSAQEAADLGGSDAELIKAAAYSEFGVKYSVGKYLDISLLKKIEEKEIPIFETYKEITLKIEIPKDIKDPSYTYGLIRAHNGAAVLLKDLDSDPDTVTVKTDRFSAYAIVYTKNIEDVNIKTANTLDRLNIFLSVTSVSAVFCSFVTLYTLWNKKNGKRSKKIK